MNAGDLRALSPLIVAALAATAAMVAIACRRNHRLVTALTLAGLAASGAALRIAWPLAPRLVTPLMVVDHFSLFYTGLVLAAAFAVTMFSYDYLERHVDPSATAGRAEPRREEFHLLLLLATIGASVLVSSVHFASLFLGLELLSVSLFALVAYPRGRLISIEAGIKYLILAGVSSAFLLFGMALVYAELGTLELAGIAGALASGNACGFLTVAGLGMILVGIGFKLSLVPFHFWAPDVYQGAPAPATAFVATVSKGAVFALLLRAFAQVSGQRSGSVVAVFTTLAIASMFVGNWLALRQTNIKRILAYSSIAHMGYLLVALLASGPWAALAVTYYLTAYFVTTLGAFGVVSHLSTGERDADAMEDYAGLAWRRPWVAGVFSAMLLSLAGIPLTAGFIGKFYVLAAGVRSDLWLLVATLAVNSAIGLFYYLRIMVKMYQQPAVAEAPSAAVPALPVMGSIALAVLTVALFWLGVFPSPALRVLQAVLAP